MVYGHVYDCLGYRFCLFYHFSIGCCCLDSVVNVFSHFIAPCNSKTTLSEIISNFCFRFICAHKQTRLFISLFDKKNEQANHKNTAMFVLNRCIPVYIELPWNNVFVRNTQVFWLDRLNVQGFLMLRLHLTLTFHMILVYSDI